ncbi:MAG: tetratricopeptide repeat protein [Candidatus Marinimicrobia bacterium]|nr:tetratricopeptide repeat protein [Candidatus Neomarinimicrobiota bacterium]MCF7905425.1 tetratricopeptide repeat protein [Candidatus Neomarinimicrobiota bacterium]
MSPFRTILTIFLLLSSLTLLAQDASNLFYDIGLVIEDTTGLDLNTPQESTQPGELSMEQLALEEELNRYVQKLAETEIRLRYQTMVIDSLQSEISLIKAAGETDKALLTTKITDLVNQQEQANASPAYSITPNAVSDSAFAELETPWNAAVVKKVPTSPAPVGSPLTTKEEQAAYRLGLTKFHQEYYYQAIKEFNTIVHRGTDLNMKANAQYWVGRCYYEKGQYDEAISTLEQVQRYTSSDKLDDALVLIGLAFKNKNRLPEAKLAFQELVTKHPGSEYLTLAKRFVQE